MSQGNQLPISKLLGSNKNGQRYIWPFSFNLLGEAIANYNITNYGNVVASKQVFQMNQNNATNVDAIRGLQISINWNPTGTVVTSFGALIIRVVDTGQIIILGAPVGLVAVGNEFTAMTNAQIPIMSNGSTILEFYKLPDIGGAGGSTCIISCVAGNFDMEPYVFTNVGLFA